MIRPDYHGITGEARNTIFAPDGAKAHMPEPPPSAQVKDIDRLSLRIGDAVTAINRISERIYSLHLRLYGAVPRSNIERSTKPPLPEGTFNVMAEMIGVLEEQIGLLSDNVEMIERL